MKTYSLILCFRALELVFRFLFVGVLVRELSVSGYGEISFSIALMQGVALFLFAFSIQSFSFLGELEKRSLFKVLFALALILAIILYLLFGSLVSVFLFYALINLCTAWYTSEKKQLLFTCLRATSFLPMALIVLLYHSEVSAELVSKSFFGGAVVLIISMPWAALRGAWGPIPVGKIKNYWLHSFLFQLTKPLERIVFNVLLDSRTFGLYSTLRDFAGAVNLLAFSSFYQLYFKQMMQKTNKDLMATLNAGMKALWLAPLLIGGAYLLAPYLSNFTYIMLEKSYAWPFFVLFATIVVFDLLKAILLMAVESRGPKPILLKLDAFDLGVLLSLLMLTIWAPYVSIFTLSLLLIYRFLTINCWMLYVFRKNENTFS